MDNVKNKKKITIILTILTILVVLLGVLIFNAIFNNDGMKQTKGVSIYYRTYTKEDGWSKWVKNGKTSGDLKHDIKNVQIKINTKKYSKVLYSLYNQEWSDSYTIDSKIKNTNIYAFKASLSDGIYKDYNIYYRTYNSNDKWLDWTFAGYPSGNKNENIKGIEIKVVPKKVTVRDYLKDYNNTNNNASVGF